MLLALILALTLQQQIDELAAKGGGTLDLPAGEYQTGALFFKPGVNLHLQKGARIVGSDLAEDYPQRQTRIEGETCTYYPALINADGCDGFTISGEGEIDGHGRNTWEEFWAARAEARKTGADFRNKWLMRPRLLYVTNSKNVDVSGVTFKNSKFWTTHYYQCEDVFIHDCRIVAEIFKDRRGKEVKGPSTDAIDLDKCNYVTVSNVYISVNDDGIAVKGGKGPFADNYAQFPDNGPTSNVLIEDCTFAAPTHSCLTLGSECPEASGITMKNCKMEGPGNMLCLKARTDTPQHYSNVTVEGMTGTCRMFYSCGAWTQYEDLQGRSREDVKTFIDAVTIRNCDVTCDRKTNYQPNPEKFVLTNLREENNKLSFRKRK